MGIGPLPKNLYDPIAYLIDGLLDRKGVTTAIRIAEREKPESLTLVRDNTGKLVRVYGPYTDTTLEYSEGRLASATTRYSDGYTIKTVLLYDQNGILLEIEPIETPPQAGETVVID